MEYVSEVKIYTICITVTVTLNQRLYIFLGPFNYPVLFVINALVGSIACNDDDDDDDIGVVDCR